LATPVAQVTQLGTVPPWVIKRAHKSVWLYALLSSLAADAGETEVYLRDLAEYTGVGLRTLQDNLRKLEDIGAVSTIAQREADGTIKPNLFVLVREEPPSAAETATMLA
jgi:hypothetical protein